MSATPKSALPIEQPPLRLFVGEAAGYAKMGTLATGPVEAAEMFLERLLLNRIDASILTIDEIDK